MHSDCAGRRLTCWCGLGACCHLYVSEGRNIGSLGQAYLACCYLPLLLLLQGLVLRHLCRVDLHVGHHRHASLHVAIHLLRHHLSLLLLLECLEALLLHLLLSDCI